MSKAKKKEKKVWEFGDFQTPDHLAAEATRVLRHLHFEPKTIIEPTCGRGAFLLAGIHEFPEVVKVFGADINEDYIDHLKDRITEESTHSKITLKHADFFSLNWTSIIYKLEEPILILGNPPWVTSSELGMLDSSNLPEKSNFQGRKGLDAITGKGNFDISEWMILQYLQWLKGKRGYIAVLCKTAVVRKILNQLWKQGEQLSSSRMYLVDALKYFGASVEACFFVIELGDTKEQECFVYDSLAAKKPSRRFGYHEGILVSNIELYEKWQHLRGSDTFYKWRSGVKHDCAKVLELEQDNGAYVNGYGENVRLEDKYLYPLYKSSDIGHPAEKSHRKYLLVTQQYVGAATNPISYDAPRTWDYLTQHESAFANRKSVIYKDQPPFSMFGIGEYTFAPWKVAISGFYKQLNFKAIGPFHSQPAVFDDTIYFLPCWSKSEADFLVGILNSKPAQEFLTSMTFWSDKRPITAELLKRINLKALSQELGRIDEYFKFTGQLNNHVRHGQLALGVSEKKVKYTSNR